MAIGNFVILFIFLAVSACILISLVYLEKAISPKEKSVGMERAAVESAERPLPGARLVGFQYYLYAILFVIIEALLVFLLLWGESYQQIGVYSFIAVGIGLLYMLILVRYFLKSQNDIIQ